MRKRVALYVRVSTIEQSPQSQLNDLRVLAEQRDLVITDEYVDHGVSGIRTSRPALDRLLADARRGKFEVLATWAFDRLARSVAHLIRMLDELQELGIEFLSYREALDTNGPMGRAITVILGAIAELERSIIRERVCAGIRRARREGRRLGRRPVLLDADALVENRKHGASIRQLAAIYGTSKSTIQRILAKPVPKSLVQPLKYVHALGLDPTLPCVPELPVSGPPGPPAPALQGPESPAKTLPYCGETQQPQQTCTQKVQSEKSA